jgi:hypothetical protein
MPNYNFHHECATTPEAPPRPILSYVGTQPESRPGPEQFLAALSPALAAWRRRPHQGGSQVIIRFLNGYGAIISEHRLLAKTYEVAPLRFSGPGLEDYEFYFRSHVADLTWCSEPAELLGICQQISRLRLPGADPTP